MPRSARSSAAAGATLAAPFATRPLPPEDLRWNVLRADCRESRYAPAPDVAAWLRTVFIESTSFSPVQNTDHEHLAMANIGVLWAMGESRRQGRRILGTAEIPNFKGDGWQRGRQAQQLRDWFPEFEFELPDFVITLDAPACTAMTDGQFCALVEHELYHCGQMMREGAPVFSRSTGLPLWAIRGHDIEQFTGVMRRYGPQTLDEIGFIHAAAQHAREPVFSTEALAGACGACQ